MMCPYKCGVFFQSKIVIGVDLLADTFTPLAYPYVGLFHYRLQEAGHSTNELFEKRDWSRIVMDELITGVLFLCNLTIGGLACCCAVLLERGRGASTTSVSHPVLPLGCDAVLFIS